MGKEKVTAKKANINPYSGNILKLYIYNFLTSMHFFSAVLVPMFTLWGHISFFQITLLQSWFMLWVFILEVPTGTIADYLGRKYSLFLSAVVWIIGVLVYSSTPDFIVFLIGEMLLATSVALASGADEALMYDSLKKLKRTKDTKLVMGRFESMHMGGLLVSAFFGGFIATSFGLNSPLKFTAFPAVIAAFIALSLKEPGISAHAKKKNYFKILREGMSFFYKSSILKILAFDMISVSAVAYMMIWLYQNKLSALGFDITYFGVVHTVIVIAEILVMNNYVFFEKIFGSKKGYLFFSAFVTGISILAAGLLKSIPLAIVSIVISIGFGLTRYPYFSGFMNKSIPSSKRATVLSSISMLRRISMAILNPIVGFFVGFSLDYTLVFLGSLIVFFAFVSKVEERHLVE